MERHIPKTTKWRILSLSSLGLGAPLLAYMIRVEGEPGALPLFLILLGTAAYVIHRMKQ